MGRQREPLPDPAFGVVPGVCARCGYDVTGIDLPGRCPECGLALFVLPVVLCGTARAVKGARPLWRTLLWAYVFVGGFVISQGVAFAIFLGGAFVLILLATVVGVLILLMATGGTREQRTTERFTFLAGGLYRAPLRPTTSEHATQFIAWDEPVTARVEPIGEYWARLFVNERRSERRLLDLGFRCPRAMAPRVELAIEGLEE